MKKSFDDFFDRDDIPPPKSRELIEEIEKLKSVYTDIEKLRQATFDWLDQITDEAFPEVEELSVHCYEDGISQLEFMLRIRQIEVMDLWQGNKKTNPLQIIQKMMSDTPS